MPLATIRARWGESETVPHDLPSALRRVALASGPQRGSALSL